MAYFHSPTISTNGLVLCLDAANGESFRGEPTTNLANTDFSRTIQFHRQGDYGNAGSISDAPEKGAGWKKITITNRGSNFRIAQFPYISHPTNTVRTYSVEVDFALTTGYYLVIDGFNGFGPSQNTNGTKSFTVTTTTNSGALAIFLYHNTTGVSGLNDVIYYRNYQVENKAYATPFTETSRGTTVATGGGFGDLTGNGNNGELVNGTTYNSSNLGSLVFDGVDDYVSIPSFTFTPYCLDFWLYNNNVVPGNDAAIGGPSTYQTLIAYGYPAGVNLGGWTGGATNEALHIWSTTGGNKLTYTQTAVPIGYHNWVFNWNGSNYDIWVDGVKQTVYASTSGHALLQTFTSTIRLANNNSSYYFNGKIYSFKLYTSQLNDSQILQNYNATKGRYGL
jgi:hypothetical protein